MKTFFCLAKQHVPSGDWVSDLVSGKLSILNVGGIGLNQNWIYQTWALLITSGTPCYALSELPQEGIIITLSVALPTMLPPSSAFLVDVVADDRPHPNAPIHLVQNSAHAKRLSNAIFMPHWPQPGLIPRDSNRGTRFETVAFFGHLENLAPQLQSASWRQRLQKELGLQLHFPDPDQWHDYSQTDAIIAIRNFSRSRHFHKPATKLYNAWHAGIPFIGGRDSAYAADGRPNIDYLVATSPEEVFQHLKRLKEDESLRQSLVQQGSLSAKNFTREAVLERWRELVEKTLPALALEWNKKSRLGRLWFFTTQRFFCWINRYKKNQKR